MSYVATPVNVASAPRSQTLSADGRFVAMIGTSGSTSDGHLLLRDLQTGTIRDLVQTGNPSYARFSPDGSKLLYYANSAVSGNKQLYMLDVASGRSQIISVDSSGRELPLFVDLWMDEPSASRDGNFVVFATNASGLAPNDNNGKRDVYLKNTVTGALTLISQTEGGIVGAGESYRPVISSDGTNIAFYTDAKNLYPDLNNPSHRYSFRPVMKNLETGKIQFLDRDQSGHVYDFGSQIIITQDGMKVISGGVYSGSSFLRSVIYVKDLVGGGISLASTTDSGNLLMYAGSYAVSADGRYIFFASPDSNLAGGDSGYTNDLYRKDIMTGELKWLTPHDFNSFSGEPLFIAGASSDGGKVLIQYSVENFFGSVWRQPYNEIGKAGANLYMLSLTGVIDSIGNDSLRDPSGVAGLAGGIGNDQYWIDASGTRVLEEVGAGIDTVFSRLSDYTLPANVEYLVLAATDTVLKGRQNGRGNNLDNHLYGNGGDNILYGGDGDDYFFPAKGYDVVDGGNGSDTVFLDNEYGYLNGAVESNGNQLSVKAYLASVTMTNVERVEGSIYGFFQSGATQAEQAYRIYQAAFNRTPDSGGLGFWIKQIDKGMSVNEVARGFIQSAEFKSLYGTAPGNTEMVDKFYQNVLHRVPDGGGRTFWIDALNQKKATAAEVLAAFSESAENKAALVGVFDAGVTYQVYPG